MSPNHAQLEAAITAQRAQVATLMARLPALEQAISETATLAGEIEDRRRDAEAEYARLRIASGRRISFGRPAERTVRFTNGNGTMQLAGPKPADSPEGRAEQARRVHDAIEAEARPVNAALHKLQAEQADVKRSLGRLDGEIAELERQVQGLKAAEAEHAALIGATGWQERLAAILRRLAA
jgi:phage shock protein A